MEDLVRVGVADAAEQVRVGQRALERVVLAPQRRGERRRVRVEHFEAAGIVRGQRVPAAATTCSDARRLVPASVRISVPCVEVERQQADLARNAARPAAFQRNRPAIIRWNDEEQLALGLEDDPLAEPMQVDDRPPVDRGERRVDRAQQERRRQADAA